MEVSVTVKDGENAAAVDAEKVAEMFEGTRNLSGWGGAGEVAVTATLSGIDGATMHFNVVLGDGSDKAAFLRLAP